MTSRTPPPPPPDDWYDPTARPPMPREHRESFSLLPHRPSLQPGEREEWPPLFPRLAPGRPPGRNPSIGIGPTQDRAFLALFVACGAVLAGIMTYVVFDLVREYPLEFILGSLAVSALAWASWLVAGVLMRRDEARRQR